MTSLLLLVRNLLVARLIPVEDYGIAATFAVVMAMVEMASAFGLQQQIVQSKDGDVPRFQAALQAFQVLRGLLAGIVLFLISAPIAQFLGIPEVIWAYQLLALVPVIKAFEHFDIHRLNRQMRFWPMILSGTVPALLSLLMVWPLAVWLSDWRVLLYAILAHMGLTVILSHLMAERPYRLVFDRAIMGGSLRFGWPILANSILLFLVFQGDKLIVGHVLGMEALAIFAMGMMLTLNPTMVLAKSAQNFFLPQMSREFSRGNETEKFYSMAHSAIQTNIFNGAIVVLFFSLVGPYLIAALFHGKYDGLIPLFGIFAILNGIRVFKSGPAQVALASGHAANAMISNIPRVLALPLAWWLLESGGSLVHVLWLGCGAELTGFAVSLIMMHRKIEIPLLPMLLPACATTTFLLLASGLIIPLWENNTPFLANQIVLFLAFLFLTGTMRYLRKGFLTPPSAHGGV